MRKLALLMSLILCLGFEAVFAQTRNISGTVIGIDDGLPIPGVSIVVKGTTIGTITRGDGAYDLAVPNDAQVLVYSFVGMTAQEVTLDGQSKIDVSLETESFDMDEVVVTAMGISKARKAIGYGSSSVSGSEIASSQAVNPMNALQGKVAGVDISSAPGPGATQNVIIRGASSFGNNQPLYIVDGVPIVNSQNQSGSALNNQVDFGSGINALNPDDIAEMTVLKGAAATALYGSRAANGVILISTKKGKDTGGKMTVEYDGSLSLSRVGRLPERQDEFGQGWSGIHALEENGNWGPRYDNKMRLWGNVVDNSQQLKPYSFLEDRVRDFYDVGVNYKNAISASGGNETTKYFISGSQNSVDGVIPTDADSYDRFTIGANGSHKANKLTVSSAINFSNEKTKTVPSGQGTSLYRSLWEIPEDISVVDLEDYHSSFNNLDNYFTPYGINPYFALNENGASQKKNKFYGKAQLDYDLLEELTFTYRFGGDIENSTSEAWQAKIAYTPNSPNSSSSTVTPGNYELVKRTRYESNHDFMLHYTKQLASEFGASLLLGSNINERGYDRLTGKVQSIDVPGFYNLANGLSASTSDQYSEKRRLIGLYGNIDFDYKSYLFLTLTARNDWSSTLPLKHNSFFYPGINTSFLFSDFLKKKDINTGIINYGKIRAAYGWTGNDAEVYKIEPVYSVAETNHPNFPDVDNLKFPLGGVNSYMVDNVLGNPELKPEITKEIEFGLEMNFFKNRFGFDASYYNKITEGLIEKMPIDPSSGYTSQVTNIGDVRNRGFELLVFGTPIKIGDFSWNVSVNYAENKNKVLDLAEGEIYIEGYSEVSIVAIKGEELGLFKSTVAQTTIIDGKEYLVVDGDGNVKASADQVVLTDKSVNEKFRLGLSNTFKYKNLSLGATLDLRYGGYMYSYTKDYMHWTGSAIESTYNNRNPFVVPNSVIKNEDGSYSENTKPVTANTFHTFYSNGGFQSNDYAIIDRSYLKLREVNLSYSLPKTLVRKFNVSDVRLSIVVSNILLWTPAENAYIDPETTTFGNDLGAKFGEYGVNPSNEVCTFGLSVTF